MNTVSFANPGLLDLRAMRTFGVNVKETDNPIGFFGTGFKYALAVLLREMQKVDVFIGLEKHEISLSSADIRGKSFSIICIDGQETGFTTELGKTWGLTGALRELESNARDEKGFSRREAISPRAGWTTIQVHGEAFYNAYEELDNIFIPSHRKKLWSNRSLEVYDGRTSSIFYRGICVGQLEKPSVYTYNILDKLELTEDRTMKFFWMAKNRIGWQLTICDNARIVRTAIYAHKDFLEFDLDWECRTFLGDTVTKVIEEAVKARAHISESARRAYLKATDKQDIYEPFHLSPEHRAMFDWAVDLLETKLNCKPNRYKIELVESLGQHVMGRAIRNENKIILSSECFRLGQRYVASTLLEEYIHLAHSLDDCTRGLQDHLFNLVIDLVAREAVVEPTQPERPVAPLDDKIPF